jgi:hypothetical protein
MVEVSIDICSTVVITDFPSGTIGNNFGDITSPFMILLWEVRVVGSFSTNADSSILYLTLTVLLLLYGIDQCDSKLKENRRRRGEHKIARYYVIAFFRRYPHGDMLAALCNCCIHYYVDHSFTLALVSLPTSLDPTFSLSQHESTRACGLYP